MKKKMIIFDIDGTLYDNNTKCLYQSTIDCIKKLYDEGHELVIASGRSYPMIDNVEEIKKYINNYILINGQLILRNGETIYKECIETDKLRILLGDFEKAGIPYGCISSTGERLNRVNSDVEYAYSSFRLKEPVIDKDYYLKEDIYQIWCFGDNEKVKEFINEHQDFEFMAWGKTGYDVLMKGRNKGRTIKILANILGFDMNDIIAIGDGYNDITMLKEVGYGIAMGNACEELKEVADYVTDNISDDGLYKAFLYLGLIE